MKGIYPLMTEIDYANKVVLAPMVRIGTLPFRLLSLRYGADLVWTEETIDKKIIACERSYNPVTGTIEYRDDRSLCFSTHPDEKGKVIFQLGSADPDLALKAALTVKDDVAGIDLNCGCPKRFSIQGGMGAALLYEPERLVSILTRLVQESGLPVSCKIRLLESQEKTIELVKMIESTGIKALTVHCRTRHQRPTEKATWDRLKEIVDTVKTIPVIINGDIYSREDIQKAKELTKASSVMIARGAQLNPSIFRSKGLVPSEEVVKEYLKLCLDLNNSYPNTKYVIQSMNTMTENTKNERYRRLQQAKSLRTMSEIFDLTAYFEKSPAGESEAAVESTKNNKRPSEEVSSEAKRACVQ